MYFRSTPQVDAGGRIGEEFFPEKIDYSAKGYIETVSKALEMAAGVSGKNAEEIRKKQESERETEAKQYIEKAKEEKYGSSDMSAEDYRAKLLEIAKSLSEENRPLKKEELRKQNLPVSFSEVDDIEILKKIHAVLVE
jgi:acyl-CoA reductase-like NAD-dependent aldehyde dehydrogenase